MIKTLSLYGLFLLLLPTLVAPQPPSNDQTDQLNNFTPSMAIIIVILIAALFLMGFFSIYIRHCADSPSGSVRPLGLGASVRRSRRAPRGLDPTVIQAFPTLQYSLVKNHKIGKGALECAVCLSEFEDSETLRLIPKCDHVFHPECIDEWLASHTTCPVCRADLVPQPDQSVRGVPSVDPDAVDLEAQNQVVEPEPEQQHTMEAYPEPAEPEVLCLNQTMRRNRTRGSRSGRTRRFPRSHSTGHSLVQPGEDTERFTLRLPVEVRNQILNRELHRSTSMVVLPREGSSRRGYRIGGDGSSRGRYSRRLDHGIKSDRWVFTMAPPFLVRASSIRSPKVGGRAGEGTSAQPVVPAAAGAARPLV
ncbi:E3 ubiquitin-protein ligase ATL6-like [Prosopis cineraria]|uniref:E3 ubiquitin-protein ligase ATL6-like n=1 Tax=Prosopis cineraria TaxID=364024 RepID=UPI00240EBFFB|nr:E3 ubiquitin-protein ligase ATL6-like [Prosopis cineraria]